MPLFAVCAGTDSKFGRETGLRGLFEKKMVETDFYTEDKATPIFSSLSRIFAVVLVVEGGPGTLDTVKKAIECRTPVLIMEGSGRAADVLAYAWRYLHDETPSARHLNLSGLRQRIRKMGGNLDNNQLDVAQKEALEIVQIGEQVTVYNGENANGENRGLDQTLLACLLKAQKLEVSDNRSRAMCKYELHQRSLYLSMLFNRSDQADIVLRKLRNLARDAHNKEDDIRGVMQTDLQGALRWSLLGGRTGFVKMLCPLVELDEFLHDDDHKNLKVIFSAKHHIAPKKHVVQLLVALMRQSRHKKVQLVGRVASLMTNPGRESLSGLPSDYSLGIVNHFISLAILTNSTARRQIVDFIGQKFVGEDSVHQSSSPKLKRDHAYLDLLMWSIFFDYSRENDLGRFFWQQGGNSTSTALFASILLKAMAGSPALANGQFLNARDQMGLGSAEFESLAVGVLDHCQNDDSKLTQTILESELYHFRGFREKGPCSNCITFAVFGKQTNFLSHSGTLALMDQKWYGGIDPQTRTINIVCTAVFPLLLLQHRFLPIEMNTQDDSQLNKRRNSMVSTVELGPTESLHHVMRSMYGQTHRRCSRFYTSPFVKFLLGIVAHGVLLTTYTIASFGDFNAPNLTGVEIVLMVWHIALSSAELCDVFDDGYHDWSRHHWNWLQFFGLVVYWFGFGLRIHASAGGGYQSVEAAKLLFAMGAGGMFLQTFRMYAGISSLGPKLIMLVQMGEDVITYLALFLVFMMIYGVGSEAILGPHYAGATVGSHTLGRIAYRPWFQMFGELFLDEIMDDTNCLGPEPFQGCDYHAVLPVLTGIYLLVVNVVLVNLLIAMMSRTYNRVQEKSMALWHLQMHEVLREYQGASFLPGPFSLLQTLWLNLHHIWNLSCGRLLVPSVDKTPVVVQFSVTESRRAESFQEKHTERYLEQVKKERAASREIEIQIAELQGSQRTSVVGLNAKVDRLEAHMETMFAQQSKRLQEQSTELAKGQKTLLASIDANSRLSGGNNTEQVGATTLRPTLRRWKSASERRVTWESAVQRVISSMPTAYHTSPDREGGLWSVLDNNYDFQDLVIGGFELRFAFKNPHRDKPELYENGNIVVLFKTEEAFAVDPATHAELVHPRMPDGSLAMRQHVERNNRPWEVELEGYSPMDYTSPYTLFFSEDSPIDCYRWAQGSDPELAEKSASRHQTRSDFDGRPINPCGRTGIRGRGVLGKWGPNNAVHYVITRSALDADATPIERNGQRMQTILMCKRGDGRWLLPGTFQDAASVIDPVLRKSFGLDSNSMNDTEELQETALILLDAPECEVSYDVAGHDDRDTDNAWVENRFKVVELPSARNPEKDGSLNRFEIADDPGAESRMEWVTIHKDIRVAYSCHYRVIEGLAKRKKAFW